jgi:phage gpG-like protein
MPDDETMMSRLENLEQQMATLTPVVRKMASGMEQQAKRFHNMENGMKQLSEWASHLAQEMKEQREWALDLKDEMVKWTTGQRKPRTNGEAHAEGE